MIAAEFGEIQQKLAGAYGMLEDRQSQETWYSYIRHLEAQDVRRAVDAWISQNQRRPTIADLIEWADNFRVRRRKAEIMDQYPKDCSCQVCRDTGTVVTTYPTGVEVMAPCRACARGRDALPWYFLTEEAKEEWYKSEEKKGRRPPRHPLRAPDDVWKAALYGPDKEQ